MFIAYKPHFASLCIASCRMGAGGEKRRERERGAADRNKRSFSSLRLGFCNAVTVEVHSRALILE